MSDGAPSSSCTQPPALWRGTPPRRWQQALPLSVADAHRPTPGELLGAPGAALLGSGIIRTRNASPAFSSRGQAASQSGFSLKSISDGCQYFCAFFISFSASARLADVSPMAAAAAGGGRGARRSIDAWGAMRACAGSPLPTGRALLDDGVRSNARQQLRSLPDPGVATPVWNPPGCAKQVNQPGCQAGGSTRGTRNQPAGTAFTLFVLALCCSCVVAGARPGSGRWRAQSQGSEKIAGARTNWCLIQGNAHARGAAAGGSACAAIPLAHRLGGSMAHQAEPETCKPPPGPCEIVVRCYQPGDAHPARHGRAGVRVQAPRTLRASHQRRLACAAPSHPAAPPWQAMKRPSSESLRPA